jgi:predicted nucleotidyltransferase
MLKILNELAPFIEDCYKELGVREYAKLTKISPPTASSILKAYMKEGLLKQRKERTYLLFRTNKSSEIMKDLSRIYWRIKLDELFIYLDEKFHSPEIFLFGSLAKLETKSDSDIDIALITKIRQKIDFDEFTKKFKREIQLFEFDSIEKIPKNLKSNIIGGYKIQ